MLFHTPTQFAVLALLLVAGWFFGLASHPGGRKWRTRYEEEREARGHIAEGERLRDVDQVPQPPPERADDGVRDVGVRAVEVLEVGARKEDQPCLLDRHRRGRVGAAVEQRQLGHRAPRPLDVQHLLPPLGARPIDAHPPGLDDVEPAALFAGGEEDVSGAHRARHAPLGEARERRVVQLAEERDLAEEGNERHVLQVIPFAPLLPARPRQPWNTV